VELARQLGLLYSPERKAIPYPRPVVLHAIFISPVQLAQVFFAWISRLATEIHFTLYPSSTNYFYLIAFPATPAP